MTFAPPPARTRLALAVALALTACPLAAHAQSAKADAPIKAEAPVKADSVQKVEVKGTAADYDPRRDDTASKTVLNARRDPQVRRHNVYDVLKRAPGVTVSGKHALRMRGLGAGYTQILVNGDRPPPGFSWTR